MHLVQLLLPLYNNSGMRFEKNLYKEVRDELVNRFGGITAYTRAPVHGLWQESKQILGGHPKPAIKGQLKTGQR